MGDSGFFDWMSGKGSKARTQAPAPTPTPVPAKSTEDVDMEMLKDMGEHGAKNPFKKQSY